MDPSAIGAVTAASAGAAFVAALTYASISPQNELWGPVITRGSTSDPPRCALTFDDGPTPPWSNRVLDILARHNVKAMFFVIGRYVAQHPDLLRRIQNEGHLIGNHSYDHSHYGMMRTKAYWRRQMAMTDDAVANATGQPPRFFRPPMGVRTWHITAMARAHHHPVVNWSLGARDGVRTTSRSILDRLLPRTGAGDILLLHDGIEPYLQRDPTPTIEALPTLIDGLRNNGIQPIRLDELIAARISE